MGPSLTTVKLSYVDRFKDRHGKERFYFRRPGGPRIKLPGAPGSPEFMLAYHRAVAGEIAVPVAAAAHPTARVPEEDRTIRALVAIYYRTPLFLRLAPGTARGYRLVLDRFVAKHGHGRADQMRRIHVKTIMGDMAATPAAANKLLKRIRALMRIAIDLEWRTDDPTFKIETYEGGEFHTWTEEQIAQFQARWPTGTPQRTAIDLQLYTGQRRSDARLLTWPVDGMIQVKQIKTKAELMIPVHPALAESLAAVPRRAEVILLTSYGNPWTHGGYGNMVADAVKAAGLPAHCSSHGLRKAAARRLAEAGCTEKQIAAITGHRTLSEIARYTRAASQVELAKAAMSRQVRAEKAAIAQRGRHTKPVSQTA